MHYCLCRLSFNGALHLGTPGADYDHSEKIIHSDTLYAALTHARALVGLPMADDPCQSFAVSSLFPFVKEEEMYRYFFPKPFLRLNREDFDQDPKEAKKWKKVEWVDLMGVLVPILKGKPLRQNVKDIKGRRYWLPEDSKLKEDFSPITTKIVPRNKVSRSGGDTTIYYIERMYFQKGAGLWFLLAYDNEHTLEVIRKGLEILQDEGLGTDRNLGLGQFRFETTANPLTGFEVSGANARLSASLFCPEDPDQAEQASNYQLIRRGGWITTEGLHTYRKKNIYMFKEGSIFKGSDTKLAIQGKSYIDLTPEVVINLKAGNRVLRCGKAIFLPCKI